MSSNLHDDINKIVRKFIYDSKNEPKSAHVTDEIRAFYDKVKQTTKITFNDKNKTTFTINRPISTQPSS